MIISASKTITYSFLKLTNCSYRYAHLLKAKTDFGKSIPEPSWYKISLQDDFLSFFERSHGFQKPTSRNREEVLHFIEDKYSSFNNLTVERKFQAMKLIAHCFAHDDSMKSTINPKIQTNFLIKTATKILPELKTEIEMSFIKNLLTLVEQHHGITVDKFSDFLLAVTQHQVGRYATSLTAITKYCLTVLDVYRLSKGENASKTIKNNLREVLNLCKKQLSNIYDDSQDLGELENYDAHFYLCKILFTFLQFEENDSAFLTKLYLSIITSDISTFEDTELTTLVYNTQQIVRMDLLEFDSLNFKDADELLNMLETHLLKFAEKGMLKPDRISYVLYSFCRLNYYPERSLSTMKDIVLKNINMLSVQQVSLLNLSLRSMPKLDTDHTILRAIIVDYYNDTNLSRLFMPDLYFSFYPLRTLNMETLNERDQQLIKNYLSKLIALFDHKMALFSDGTRLRILYEMARFRELDFRTFKLKYSNVVVNMNFDNLTVFEFLILGSILRKYLMTHSAYLSFLKDYVEAVEKKIFTRPIEKDWAVNNMIRIQYILSMKVEERGVRNSKALETLKITSKYIEAHKANHNPEVDGAPDGFREDEEESVQDQGLAVPQ